MEVDHLDVVLGSTNQTSQGWLHRLASLVGVSGLGGWNGVGQGLDIFLGCFVSGNIIQKVKFTLVWDFGMEGGDISGKVEIGKVD